MVQIFFALCGIYPYGEYSILTGDMDLEFVNFYAYFINIFRTKNDLSYMFAKTLGGDFPGLAAFQLHDPLLFLLFLFPGDRIAAGIEFMFSVQVSIAGLSASILLNNRYKRSWLSLIFSTAYSFCAFFFGYLVLTIYFGCLAILPLVIYFFLEFLDEKKGFIPFIVTAALYIYINYHMGFMLVIFILLLYVSRLIADVSYIKMLGRFIYAGVTVLLLDGFFLIRTGLSLLGEKTTEGADYGFYRNFPMNQLFANLFSGSTRNELMPLIYSSMAALFFSLLYFIASGYALREKLANLFLLASIFVSMWINTIDAVWHGFNNPEGFYFRYAYYVSIILIALGYKGFLYLLYGEEKIRNKIIKVLAVFCLLFLYIAWLIVTGNAYLDRERQIINAAIILPIMVLAVMSCMGGRLRIVSFILLAMISVPDMLYDARVTYMKLNANDGELPLMSKFKEDYGRIGEAVAYVKSEDDGFYRLEKDFERAVNDPAMFDYIGLSHDSSCEKDAINRYMTNFGFRETVYYTYYNGGSTSFADAFLGVKYLISQYDEINKPYDFMAVKGGYGIFKDDYALPMAYVAPDELEGYEFSDENTFEKQNHLATLWDSGSKADIYERADYDKSLMGCFEEEAGHFVKNEEEAYIVYNVHITRDMPLYFYFAAPHMQSGEVFVNGESLGWYFTENRWNVLCAGAYDAGDDVEIRMQILKDDLFISEACFYYEDEEALRDWALAASSDNAAISPVTEISSSRLEFTTDSGRDSLIVLSMPYDTGWKIYSDGKSVKQVPAVEMLTGIRLEAGAHDIRMKYVPHGTVPGIIVSVAGIVMLIFGIIFDGRYRKESEKII